ncbi:MAG: NAD(P)H-dependent oxidoreductase [Pygmaiobacter massiliensis]|nr:NAD(P)H-dependent oxidoreductase [Pygmaiobacter massiliensis]
MQSETCLTLICPGGARPGGRLSRILTRALGDNAVPTVRTAAELCRLTGRRLLFAVELGPDGINLEWYRMLCALRRENLDLSGCTAGVIVDGASELYTKALARQLVLAVNMQGCLFVGGPLVEATGSLQNFAIRAKNAHTDLESAYLAAVKSLAERVQTFCPPRVTTSNITVLHASSYKTSNTMALWQQVKNRLGEQVHITEIGLRNGTLADCSGCPYTMCRHFGERGDCFYGGVMVQEVYPALQKTDALVLICPNYNDSISANLSACINRMTALFRTRQFYNQALYGIVVSGYSGSDLVAEQLIGALSMNKTFYLPPKFCLMETANDPGTALALDGIDDRLNRFADAMLAGLCADRANG